MDKKYLTIYKNSKFRKLIEKIKKFFGIKRKEDGALDEKATKTDSIEEYDTEYDIEYEKKHGEKIKYEKVQATEVKTNNKIGKEENFKSYKKHFVEVYGQVKNKEVKIEDLDDIDLLFVNRFLYNEIQNKSID